VNGAPSYPDRGRRLISATGKCDSGRWEPKLSDMPAPHRPVGPFTECFFRSLSQRHMDAWFAYSKHIVLPNFSRTRVHFGCDFVSPLKLLCLCMACGIGEGPFAICIQYRNPEFGNIRDFRRLMHRQRGAILRRTGIALVLYSLLDCT
jgi:hypothetical protein